MWMDSWALDQPPRCWPPHPEAACAGERVLFRCFETLERVVVLASSNDPERETRAAACAAQGVPVLRRRGGGGTVVLGEGCVVLTLAFFARELFGNERHFAAINQLWIDALSSLGAPRLVQAGISDLAFGDRKVAGTSLFRKKHLVVFQGSLLVDPNFTAIETLLAHPSREPGYRAGRPHSAFLTSLRRLGCGLLPSEIAAGCTAFLAREAVPRLKPLMVPAELLAD